MGQFRFVEARFISPSGHRCHFPVRAVLYPFSTRISASVAHSEGMCPFAPGNPIAASLMQAIPLVVWFLPVSSAERVGEHRAVVCHWE